MTPGGLHAFFAERAAASPAQDQAGALRLAEKYGMEVVGPPLGKKLGLS
jgi:hypothetical protein